MQQKHEIAHENLFHFTASRHGRRNVIMVERVVENPVILWFNGLNHFQSLYFEPNQPNHSNGREFIGIEEIDVPPSFFS
ncbi:hypothetical protein niasHT_016555 [Heterodera trifolii]|uniref:Uncharacterized protein n=1 Tax=Heterodera trifolii TaxID=157864 RepID=A0ABD2LK77_9BILA